HIGPPSALSTATPWSIPTSGCATRRTRRSSPTWRRRTPTPTPAPRTWTICAPPWSRSSSATPRRRTCPCRSGATTGGTSPAPPGHDYPAFTRVAEHPDLPRGEGGVPAIEPGVLLEGEQVLLDAQAEAAGAEFYSLGGLVHSPDHSLLAYAVD